MDTDLPWAHETRQMHAKNEAIFARLVEEVRAAGVPVESFIELNLRRRVDRATYDVVLGHIMDGGYDLDAQWTLIQLAGRGPKKVSGAPWAALFDSVGDGARIRHVIVGAMHQLRVSDIDDWLIERTTTRGIDFGWYLALAASTCLPVEKAWPLLEQVLPDYPAIAAEGLRRLVTVRGYGPTLTQIDGLRGGIASLIEARAWLPGSGKIETFLSGITDEAARRGAVVDAEFRQGLVRVFDKHLAGLTVNEMSPLIPGRFGRAVERLAEKRTGKFVMVNCFPQFQDVFDGLGTAAYKELDRLSEKLDAHYAAERRKRMRALPD